MSSLDPIFRQPATHAKLPLQEERELIIAARAGNGDATWQLLLQYRGTLRSTAYDVQSRVKMTADQVDDLESSLVLAAVEAIHSFDLDKHIRLSQVLPNVLKHVATETTTALHIPRGTLALWFKIWREATHADVEPTALAPDRGMSANTFRAIAHALDHHTGSEWARIPDTGGYQPTADEVTYDLAHQALALLTPAEREVIELFYGFRGDPKSDQEVANIMETPRVTASKRRERGLERMRAGLAA